MKRIALLILLSVAAFVAVQAQTPQTIVAIDSLTRPANGTQYTANDVVNDTASTAKLLRFTSLTVNKGLGGTIIGAVLTAGDTANTANGNFKLLLFRDTVGTVADNSAWATAAYYNTLFIGEIDFALTANGTAASYSSVSTVVPFQTASDDTGLYGVLLAKGAYTPGFRQRFIVKLIVVRN